jgi:hypothetical protein
VGYSRRTKPRFGRRKKSRARNGRPIWLALVCLSQFDDILSGRTTDEGKFIGASIGLGLVGAILMFRIGRRMKQHRNHPSGVRGEAEQKDQP